MKLSSFGEKVTGKTGILELMDDLGKALAGSSADTIMLGGGNPAHIPEIEKVWKQRLQAIGNDSKDLGRTLGNYSSPQGDDEFINTAASYYNNEFGWNICKDNVFVTHGSQIAFFFLFNILAGPHPDGTHKKILFPLVPEYIGYADQGIAPEMFSSNKPIIEITGQHAFKYKIDFNTLQVTDDIAAICVSRPTNPSGNVLDDEEISKLSSFARQHQIPLIVDNAYGMPFPNIIFKPVNAPEWNDSMIFVNSLSKLGLPGTRTAVVIGSAEIVSALKSINAIAALAPSNIGQKIMLPLLADGGVTNLANSIVHPFYEKKSKNALAYAHTVFNSSVPYYFHENEGSIFLWLWVKGLPISCYELYQRLKAKGVIVVPGNFFFPGFADTNWSHTQECLRISYIPDEKIVQKGLKIIAHEINTLF